MIIYTVAIIIELGAEPVPLAPLTSLPLLLAFSKPIKRVKLIVKRKKKDYLLQCGHRAKRHRNLVVPQFHQCGPNRRVGF